MMASSGPGKSRTPPATVRCSRSHRPCLTAITHRVYSQCVCIVCALGEYHGILPPTPPCSGACPQRQPWPAGDTSVPASTFSNALAAEDRPPCAGGRGDELGGDSSGGGGCNGGGWLGGGARHEEVHVAAEGAGPSGLGRMMSAGFWSVWTLTILKTKRSYATRT
jgi:hypothetical protein